MILMCFKHSGQEVKVHQLDTIAINLLSSKKVVAYKFHNLTFYTDIDSFTKGCQRLYNDLQHYDKSTRKKGQRVAKAVMNDIQSQTLNADTAFLDAKVFESLQRTSDYDQPWAIVHLLASQIDCGKCYILRTDGTPVLKVIRQKIAHSAGWLEFDGGRRYISEMGDVLIQVQDWVS